MNQREVERKFVVDDEQIPFSLDDLSYVNIQQGYLAISANGDEVRVRRKAAKYYLTYKSAGDLSRSEIEVELTHDQFHSLWPATQQRRVEKRRYAIEHEHALIELDVFEGALAGLLLAEIEFSSEASSQAFQPPSWLTNEVTYDARYKNKNLAQLQDGEFPLPKTED